MSAPDISDKHLEPLEKFGSDGPSTILLGAGASVSSGLPDWDTLIVRLLVSAGFASSEESARKFLTLNHQDPVFAAEAAKQSTFKDWEKIFRRAMFQDIRNEDELEPSPMHRSVVYHQRRRPERTRLATLNFDTLLERAFRQESEQPQRSSFTAAFPSVQFAPSQELFQMRSSVPVHHLHGYATKNEFHDIVLTVNDVHDLTNSDDPWQLDYLSTAVRDGGVLIAGTSFRDPDIRQWMRRIQKQRGHLNESTIIIARESFALSSNEFEPFRDPLRQQWQSIGMNVVIVEDHADVAQIFRELSHLNSDGYQSPEIRTQTLWEHHERNFEDLQARDSLKTSEDVTILEEILSSHQLNLTVWLANGRQQLIRWAVDDRQQTCAKKLKTIQCGHDSDYYAGQVLGRDSVLQKELPADSPSRWRQILAVPITMDPGSAPPWPVGVVTVGVAENETQVSPDVSVLLEEVQLIATDWSQLFKGRYLQAAGLA